MYNEKLKENCQKITPIKLSVTKTPDELSFKEELLFTTNFLDVYGKVPLKLRYYCVLNDVSAIPKCNCCDNPATFKKDYPDQGFALYCSPKCSRSDKTVAKHIEEKLKNEEWLYEQRITLKKSKELIAKELGCSTVPVTKWLSLHEIEEKRTDVLNKKVEPAPKELLCKMYFDDNMTILDISKNFGVSNTTVGSWFELHNIEKIPHSTTIKTKVIKKIKQTCIKKYGVEFASQKHFSREIIEKLNDPRWLYKEHIVNKKSLTKISKELGISDITVKSYFTKYDIETKLYNFSNEEKELADFLSNYFEIERNDRKLIKPKELDILFPNKNIAIEYNGCFWHSTFTRSDHLHQFEKFKLCQDAGIKLITIYDDEWNTKKDLVKSKLLHILGVSKELTVYARSCKVINLAEKSIIKEFQNTTHIQGYSKGSINLGLEYNGELVALMTFKKYSDHYELSRYSTKYKITGGFSKILKHFRTNYPIMDIITFADLRWHNGETYIKNGFIFDEELKPDYQYFVNKKREHKFNYRLSQIKKKFPDSFNENETEFKNMDRIGIPRIYDCGKIRYRLK